MSVAYAVPTSWRPASMISNEPFAGTSPGDTFFHVAPPSAVICTTPLFVAAQMTPAFTYDSEKVVMDGTDGDGGRGGVCARPGTSVRSGLTSFPAMPPSVDFIMYCVP